MVHGIYGLGHFLAAKMGAQYMVWFFGFSKEGYSGFRMVGIARGQFMVDLVRYCQQA